MKNQFIFAVFLSFISTITLGQTLDNQWLMIDGKGKTGCGTNGVNTYSSAPLNTPNIQLDSVRQPALASPQMARNDIFVIYDDGSYYNSRDVNATNYNPNFFLPAVGSTPTSTHRLQGSRNIGSMYLTNVYEGDDLPPNVRASSWSSPQSATITFPNSTPIQSITANHDIVMGKDVTLIINNSPGSGLATGDSLCTNMLIYGTGTPVTNSFFTVSRVFSNGTNFSNKTGLGVANNGNIGLGTITPNNPPYIFINLRPTNALLPYINYAKVKFSIKHQGQSTPFTFLDESVRAAHDPNYMKVLSTCQKSDNSKFVKYHLEFDNTGTQVADTMQIEFRLPEYFHAKCISRAVFFIGGAQVKGKVHRSNHRIWFEFDKAATLGTCAVNPQLCTGYVEFWAKIKKNKDLRSLDTHLKLENANVIFNHQLFEIELFEDLPMVHDPTNPGGNSLRQAPVTSCDCGCGIHK